MILVDIGRIDEATASITTAVELDPSNQWLVNTMNYILTFVPGSCDRVNAGLKDKFPRIWTASPSERDVRQLPRQRPSHLQAC